MALDDDAKRQYIDARTVFQAWEDARKVAKEVTGGMYWKHAGETDYLIRTSTKNSQKSLGPRSAETEAIYTRFFTRKTTAEDREKSLREMLKRHQRLNRALHVGRVPAIVVDILDVISAAGLSDYFTVVGTHALYAFEAAVGVRIMDSSAMETRDVDLLWDSRKRVQFVSNMKQQGGGMIGLLQKVDASFQIRHDQQYTATNSKGFEVDIIRREVEGNDPHPVRLSDAEDDFWVTQARNAGSLLSAPRFSSVIVSSAGYMARMNTISPLAFARFKRWMAEQADRDPLKRSRDLRQAEVVDALVDEYLPHLRNDLNASRSG
ncbi:MAG: GSU2403 family nucleotidyltransferase fold protein [Rhodocyclaceae bacterium]